MRSTLDLSLQKEIEQIVREETVKLKSANLRYVAVVVINKAKSLPWLCPPIGMIPMEARSTGISPCVRRVPR